MDAYKPVPPYLTTIQSDEKHLHSFIIEPWRRQKSGGFFLKITVNQPDGTRFFLHLTDKRIILEPHQRGQLETAVIKGFMAAAAIFIPDAGGAVAAAERDMNKGKIRGDAQTDIPYIIPLERVQHIETFRQGIGKLARLVVKDRPKDDLIFAVADPGSKTFILSLAHPQKFSELVNRVLSEFDNKIQ